MFHIFLIFYSLYHLLISVGTVYLQQQLLFKAIILQTKKIFSKDSSSNTKESLYWGRAGQNGVVLLEDRNNFGYGTRCSGALIDLLFRHSIKSWLVSSVSSSSGKKASSPPDFSFFLFDSCWLEECKASSRFSSSAKRRAVAFARSSEESIQENLKHGWITAAMTSVWFLKNSPNRLSIPPIRALHKGFQISRLLAIVPNLSFTRVSIGKRIPKWQYFSPWIMSNASANGFMVE